MGTRVYAPEPPTRWRRSRWRCRRAARFPPHTNGVGAAFQCPATASNHAMIWPVSTRVLPVQRPPLQDPLDALGHVQPRPPHRRVQRHDAVFKQPAHERGGLVPGQVVQHQEHPQRRQFLQQRRLDGQTRPASVPTNGGPSPPAAASGSGIPARIAASSRFSQGCRTALGQARHALDADPAVGRVEQRQDLGRAVAEVLVGQASRLARRPPAPARVGDRLERPGLVGAPDRQAHRLAEPVGVLDQLFLGSASGSVTTAAPALRRRRAVPVGHQVRVF